MKRSSVIKTKCLRRDNSLRLVIFPESYRYPTKDFGIFSMGCHPQNTQNELDPGVRSYDNVEQQKVRGLTESNNCCRSSLPGQVSSVLQCSSPPVWEPPRSDSWGPSSGLSKENKTKRRKTVCGIKIEEDLYVYLIQVDQTYLSSKVNLFLTLCQLVAGKWISEKSYGAICTNLCWFSTKFMETHVPKLLKGFGFTTCIIKEAMQMVCDIWFVTTVGGYKWV